MATRSPCVHHRLFVPLLLPAAVLLAACGGGAAPAAAPPATSVAPASPTAGPAAAAPASAGPWVMPDLVGTVLQDAQDRIQALTGREIFVTTSHDATGAGRSQVLDRNWRVCDQNVAPGRSITADTKIDFGAVKLTERC